MFEGILRSHLTRYPDMQIQDVYKLVHQAAMGSEHAVTDPGTARKWIERELAEMCERPSEPLVDPLSPDGEIVRVHLRPYVLLGASIEELVEAFLCTANEYHGDIVLLEHYWKIAANTGNFLLADMEHFIQPMKANYYPAAHHSPEYTRAYHPAYRVISKRYCPWLIKLAGIGTGITTIHADV